MGGFSIVDRGAFVWRQGRAEVTLERTGDAWTVVYTSTGRLLGPRQILYQGRHRDPTYAAWDVMARVIRASRDEDEGLRAGRSAAQWLKHHPPPRDDPALDDPTPPASNHGSASGSGEDGI